LFYLSALFVLFLDIVLKFFTVKQMTPGQSHSLISGLLHITYVQNYGSAFGYFRDHRLFLSIIGIIICLLVIYIYLRSSKKNKLINFSFGLIIGGSLGNLFNRISLGYVIDYIDFRFFPVFNLADIAINIGVAVIVYLMIFKGTECIQ
jgi:signal peptidase II